MMSKAVSLAVTDAELKSPAVLLLRFFIFQKNFKNPTFQLVRPLGSYGRAFCLFLLKLHWYYVNTEMQGDRVFLKSGDARHQLPFDVRK